MSDIAHVRRLLLQTPNLHQWDELVYMLESWTPQEEQALALDYVRTHIQHWPAELLCLFQPPKDHPCWPLARKVRWYGQKGSALEDSLPLDQLRRHTNITSLELFEWHACHTLNFLSELPHLTHLHLTDFNTLTSIGGLSALDKLGSLVLNNCPMLTHLHFEKKLGACKELKIVGCGELADPHLEGLPHLERLILSKNKGLTSLHGLEACTELRFLNLNECEGLQSLDVSSLTKLSFLAISDCERFLPLTGLEALSSLVFLHLRAPSTDGEVLRELSCLSGMRALEELHIQHGVVVRSLGQLGRLPQLKTLYLNHFPLLEHIDDSLAGASQLRHLTLSHFIQLESLDLRQLPALRYLHINKAESLTSLNGLKDLTQLETLIIRQCPELSASEWDIHLFGRKEVAAFQEHL